MTPVAFAENEFGLPQLERAMGEQARFASRVEYARTLCGRLDVGPFDSMFYIHPDAPVVVFHPDGTVHYNDVVRRWDAVVHVAELEATGMCFTKRVKADKLLDIARLEAQRWHIGQLKDWTQAQHAVDIRAIAEAGPCCGTWETPGVPAPGQFRERRLGSPLADRHYTMTCRPRTHEDGSLGFITSRSRGDEVERNDLIEAYFRSQERLCRANAGLRTADAALYLAMLRVLPCEAAEGRHAVVSVNGRSYWFIASHPDVVYAIWTKLSWPEADPLIITVA